MPRPRLAPSPKVMVLEEKLLCLKVPIDRKVLGKASLWDSARVVVILKSLSWVGGRLINSVTNVPWPDAMET